MIVDSNESELEEFNLSVFSEQEHTQTGVEKIESISMIDEKAFSLLRLKQMFDSSRVFAPISLMIPSSTEIISLPRKPTTTHKSSKKEVTDDCYCA